MSKVCDPDIFCEGCGERNPICYCGPDQFKSFPILKIKKLRHKGDNND